MYTLEKLRRHRDSIHAIGKRYGVRSIQLFGSVVRGEASPRSDIDFLVDIEPGRSLMDQAGFMLDVEELLGCPVDVVVEGGINPRLKERIHHEAQPL